IANSPAAPPKTAAAPPTGTPGAPVRETSGVAARESPGAPARESPGAAPPVPPAPKLTPRHEAIRQIVAAIVDAASRNRQPAAGQQSLVDDALTEYYFRQAAARAAELPREHAVPAYLLGLAIALD